MQRAVEVFSSRLGWVAMVFCEKRLHSLSFGHASRRQALAAVGAEGEPPASTSWSRKAAQRLREYAAGRPVDLSRIAIAEGSWSSFQRRVYAACRAIPYGETLSYAQLADKAGSPHAARAVGNCMAANRIPLVIPCHRVVTSGGRLGRYSAPGGVAMKRRLLRMESQGVAHPGL